MITESFAAVACFFIICILGLIFKIDVFINCHKPGVVEQMKNLKKLELKLICFPWRQCTVVTIRSVKVA